MDEPGRDVDKVADKKTPTAMDWEPPAVTNIPVNTIVYSYSRHASIESSKRRCQNTFKSPRKQKPPFRNRRVTDTKRILRPISPQAGIFILYLTTCANDFCRDKKRQTVSAADVMQVGAVIGSGRSEIPSGHQRA